ncbi:MAG: DUF5318 family protein [Actinomycetota bacterium]|nr:hypothetical protein [Acidimicrobiaceae bacterium]MEC7915170.1 DUF5318 family protein [Actinomycetota bacterium]
MQFHTGLVSAEEPEGPAEIDYRLQRRRLLDEIERGVVDRDEACDVHPELLRVARNVAPAINEPCPLCQTDELRIVAYVFGPRLGPGGKCVISDEELQRIGRRRGKFTSYEVEVCAGCGWNHLRRRYPLG